MTTQPDGTTAPAVTDPPATDPADGGATSPTAATPSVGDVVRYKLDDGTEAHALCVGHVGADDDRDDALVVVPLGATVTITADSLVDS